MAKKIIPEKITADQIKLYDTMDGDIKEQLTCLIYQFEPENMTCDGEVRGKHLLEKRTRLIDRWNTLVKQSGIAVDFYTFEEYILG